MNIRASMLPGYNDCTRRAVAKQFRKRFEQDGYTFTELPPSVGSSVGTAVHLSTGELDKALWSGQSLSVDSAVEMGIASLSEELASGAIWDDTTPNINVAQEQIRRMTSVYVPRMPLTVNDQPAVELGLKADCGNGWMLTGHMDLIDEHGFLIDKKTGSRMRSYHGQFGGYSLLVRSNKIAELTGLGMLYIPRMAKGKHQAPPVMQEYGITLCERNAMGTIKRIKSDMALYEQAGDLDVAFPCNNSSQMCTPKYCLAFGTEFCVITK